MKTFYFTFGLAHPTYSHTAATVTVPDTPDAHEVARDKFMSRFGTSWSMQYGEEEYQARMAQYNYEVRDYMELVPVEYDPFESSRRCHLPCPRRVRGCGVWGLRGGAPPQTGTTVSR